MLSTKLSRVLIAFFLRGTVYFIVDSFSEEKRFLRFTREAGTSVEDRPFTSSFVTKDQIQRFISTRGYDNAFVYFEDRLGLSPSTQRPEDKGLSTNAKSRILDKGANAVTVYSIVRYFGIGSVETRIILFHKDGDVLDMTSREFSTAL